MLETARSPVVRLDLVSRTYREDLVSVSALRAVSAEIRSGVFAVIAGPSGSGKTTLLNVIGCIDRPDSGRIEVCGRDVSQLSDVALSDFRARYIGYVFQSFNLLPVLSAFENVEYPLLLLNLPATERRRRTLAMLEEVGLAAQTNRKPSQLSGGQKQRVAIARALIKRPALVLADEPTANLDSVTGSAIVDLMRGMQRTLGTSFILSTHDARLVAEADQTFSIRDGALM